MFQTIGFQVKVPAGSEFPRRVPRVKVPRFQVRVRRFRGSKQGFVGCEATKICQFDGCINL